MKPQIPLRSRAMSCYVLRRIEGRPEVLLLRRVGDPLDGEWCQVAGRLEEGEKAWEGVLRELKEETALVPDRFYSGDICEQFYNAFADVITLIPVFVAWIDKPQDIVLNEEHSDFGWFELEEALTRLPFHSQRQTLQTVWQGFVHDEPTKHLAIPLP
ncbi:MAG: NUDIX domain-containing protein [Alphaproteobacteria bacterium]|nr:MAG: NUDIX domain-containing protein [Alphaproteobacteria bacterium]